MFSRLTIPISGRSTSYSGTTGMSTHCCIRVLQDGVGDDVLAVAVGEGGEVDLTPGGVMEMAGQNRIAMGRVCARSNYIGRTFCPLTKL